MGNPLPARRDSLARLARKPLPSWPGFGESPIGRLPTPRAVTMARVAQAGRGRGSSANSEKPLRRAARSIFTKIQSEIDSGKILSPCAGGHI